MVYERGATWSGPCGQTWLASVMVRLLFALALSGQFITDVLRGAVCTLAVKHSTNLPGALPFSSPAYQVCIDDQQGYKIRTRHWKGDDYQKRRKIGAMHHASQ